MERTMPVNTKQAAGLFISFKRLMANAAAACAKADAKMLAG